jgi:hypothetical protein
MVRGWPGRYSRRAAVLDVGGESVFHGGVGSIRRPGRTGRVDLEIAPQERLAPSRTIAASLLRLQSSVGNRAVTKLLRDPQTLDPEKARVRRSARLVAELARAKPATAIERLAGLSDAEWRDFSWSDVPETPERVKSMWNLEYLRREIGLDGGAHYRQKVMKGSDAYGDLEFALAEFDDDARQAFLKHVGAGTVLKLAHSTWQFAGKDGVRSSLFRGYAIKLVGEDRDAALVALRDLSVPDLEAVEDAGERLSSRDAAALAKLIRTVRDDPTISMLRNRVANWPDDIRNLKEGLIDDVWKANARHVEPDTLTRELVMLAISIASEGWGGVVYGLIERALVNEHAKASLVHEFAMLAGLEAGDIAAEHYYRALLNVAEDETKRAAAKASEKHALEKTFSEKAFAELLKESKGDALDTFVAAAKRQAHVQADLEKDEFDKTGAAMTYRDLLARKALQKQAHDRLMEHPHEFLGGLTLGYLKMLDEAYLEGASHDGGGRGKALREDDFPGHGREGKVDLWPSEKHSIGTWGHPDLEFPGFRLFSKGQKTATEETLLNLSPQALPVTLAFNFLAINPISGFWHPDKIIVSFVRDAAGRFFVREATVFDDVREWLASYYTRKKEQHTGEELDRNAPLGAEKLYNAIKDKPITKAE